VDAEALDELRPAVTGWIAAGLDGLILDLRAAGGRDERAAAGLAGLLGLAVRRRRAARPGDVREP
jgi:predicted regulator of Ras-like GTPase activity (Roadblock/LC7/MglB family)